MTTRTSTAPNWKLRAPASETEARLARDHGLSPATARLLALRGFGTADAVRAHLEPKLTALHDPRLLGGSSGKAAPLLPRELLPVRTISWKASSPTGTSSRPPASMPKARKTASASTTSPS